MSCRSTAASSAVTSYATVSTRADEKVTQGAFHALRQAVNGLDLETPTAAEWTQFLDQQRTLIQDDPSITDARRNSLLTRLDAARGEDPPDGATFFAMQNLLDEVRGRLAKQQTTGADSDAPASAGPDDPVEVLSNRLTGQFPGLSLFVHTRGDDTLILSKIVVSERGQGTGGKVMAEICRYADEHGLTVALTPSADFGGTVSRLKTFYRRFGFVANSGRGRDYSISETMLRRPGASGS